MPEPEYSIQGHASATITHTTAHKAHMPQQKLTFPLEHMGLNAGGVKVPLLWNNSWHLARKTCHQRPAIKTIIIKITVNGGRGMILPVTYYTV